MKRRRNAKKQEVLYGSRWPVSDPPPKIIVLLQTALNLRGIAPDPYHDSSRKELEEIVANWWRNENVAELVKALGVEKSKRGPRRKQATVNRETEIYLQVMNAALNGEEDPFEAAAGKLQADMREVQRAWEKWSFLAKRSLVSLRQNGALQDAAARALDELFPQ